MKFLRGSKLYSILTGTCPVCHRGEMYKVSNPYKLSKVYDMYEYCSHCGIKYKMEPSFFYGAMYVSYALGVAFSVATFIVAHLLFGLGVVGSFIAIVAVLILLMPIIMRLSRNIWINLFYNYKESAAEGNKDS